MQAEAGVCGIGVAAAATLRSPRTAHDASFAHAEQLLRHLTHAAEIEDATAALRADLAQARRAALSHAHEERWLRRALRRAAPELRAQPAATGQRRAGQRAQALLEYVRNEFHRPLKLATLAQEFHMNANYASFVFGREVGMPFKSYLTMLRVQRAQELLRDPCRRVSEVVTAVGYASPRRFRAAFRQRTGLSPNAWRETLATE